MASLQAGLSLALAGLLLAGCGTSAGLLPRAASPAELSASARKSAPRAAGYYAGVQGLSGRSLLNGLHKLIKSHKDLGYDHARDVMFADIDDADHDDAVRDVYTGRLVAGVLNRLTAHQQGMDTEHTWCQSMGAKGAAKDDLHHLFPVDAKANSQRGNMPFGEVTHPVTVLPDNWGDGDHSLIGDAGGVGFSGSRWVFQPRANHRGDVARAIFYFYTCYVAGESGAEAPSVENFAREHDTLLRWHQADPVTAEELARNEAIFKAQGNRNPFVDHPEWVAKIGRFVR
jgi:endonuclease I